MIKELVGYDSKLIHVIYSSDKYCKENLGSLIELVVQEVQDTIYFAEKIHFNYFLDDLLFEKYHKVLIPFLMLKNQDLNRREIKKPNNVVGEITEKKLIENLSKVNKNLLDQSKNKKGVTFQTLLENMILRNLYNIDILKSKVKKEEPKFTKMKNLKNINKPMKIKIIPSKILNKPSSLDKKVNPIEKIQKLPLENSKDLMKKKQVSALGESENLMKKMKKFKKKRRSKENNK